jgi:NAD(P)H-flavin reductase
MNESLYLPRIAVLKDKRAETPDTVTFTFELPEGGNLNNIPGQFITLTIFGYGEAPFSITSSPTQKDFQLCIRNVGNVTKALHKLKIGDKVGIRGPRGNGFPIEELKGKNAVFIAGGLGLAPLRSLINYIADNRRDYGKVWILSGARTPKDHLFKWEWDRWSKIDGFEVLTTVDRGDDTWDGNVGVVGSLLYKTDIQIENTMVFICGPPIMFHFVTMDLTKLGFKDDMILSTLERHMKCGVGKCGHCMIGSKYVCMDGPVFTYAEMKKQPGAL